MTSQPSPPSASRPSGPHVLFLDRLEASTRERFVARAVRRQFDAGELVVREGEATSGLFVTVSGIVKVFKTSINGREQILRYAPPNSSFNEVTILDGGLNPTSAEAVTATEVLMFSRALMDELIATDPQVPLALLDSIAGLYRHLMQMVEDLSFRHVSDRIAQVLLQSVIPHPGVGAGVDMHRHPTQTEIAEMIGSTREVVGRALRASRMRARFGSTEAASRWSTSTS